MHIFMYRGEIDALRQIAMFFFGENAEFFFFFTSPMCFQQYRYVVSGI